MSLPRHIHFIGVCGTGMAAAAALMKESGYQVTGSDMGVYPPMSHFLEEQGIPFATTFDPSHLMPSPGLVVIGNAVSRGNPEVEELLDLKIPYVSLPELLKTELIQGKRSLVIAGTHGKTTTTSLLAWVLESCGRDPSFFVGGVPLNFGKGIRRGRGSEVVLEGDEYDTAFFDKRPKFLHYLPDLAILNNIEFDHADIYPDIDAIERAFESLQKLIPRRGLIVANMDNPTVGQVVKSAFTPIEGFGLDSNAPWRAADIKPDPEGTAFSLYHHGHLVDRFHLPLMGSHNVLNAVAVFVTCQWLGLTSREIERGFRLFRGVKRRLEKKGTFQDVILFDDFAHHPTAISATLSALNDHYPGRPIWAVFEPRSNTTRRNYFQKQLVGSFRWASEVVIGAVHRANSIDIKDRLDPNALSKDIERELSCRASYIPEVEDIVAFLCSNVREREIVVIMSNGGFGGLMEKLMKGLANR